MVGEDVLVAYIAGDFGGDRIDILERGGEEGDASGLAGEGFEGVAGAALVAAAAVAGNEAVTRGDRSNGEEHTADRKKDSSQNRGKR